MKTNLKYLLVSFIILLTIPTYSQSDSDKFIVVLDAGHGGHDPGRPTKVDTEKKIALEIVLKIGKMLDKHSDITAVSYTHLRAHET